MNRHLANPFIHNIENEIFLPALENAISYDCMIGYFNSSSFKILAVSLLQYLKANPQRKMRFIISPHLSKEDLVTLKGLYDNNDDLSCVLGGFELTEDYLKNETLKALAFLLKNDRLEIRLAIPRKGLFHVKCWILKQNNNGLMVIHGSGNHTGSGLSRNFEYFIVENSYNSWAEESICNQIQKDFESIWDNNFPDIICGKLTLETIRLLLEQFKNAQNPTTSQQVIKALENAIQQSELEERTTNMDELNDLQHSLTNYSPSDLVIPEWLDYRNGDYKHQGEAIDAWFTNNKQGILAIATGGGKTLTSLTAATLLSRDLESLLIVVAVPTKALMEQWTREVALFNVQAINLNNFSVKNKKLKAIREACKNLRFQSSKVEAIILSHDALKSDVIEEIEKYSSNIPMLLIADEVHNLGSDGFIESPPKFFQYKIGLSATPIRQYDADGTEFLFQYFGKVVYEFALDKAIGNCLVPYNYYTHPLYLTMDESELFTEITEKIKKLSYAATMHKSSDEFKLWSNYCIQRRRIIETAENKILKLKGCLHKEQADFSYTLIFCSDKDPEQLEQVNDLLNHYHINYHQITGEETTDIKLLNQLVEDYNSGILQVLTSKRVLDEGFNVPQTRTAYILASNTTEKQWIQRLGRVLRKSPGKDYAEIHDFIVLPMMNDDVLDEDFLNLLRSEAKRLQFFIQHSRNGTEKDGSLSTLTDILNMIEH